MKCFVLLPCLLGALAAAMTASSSYAQQPAQRSAALERGDIAKLRGVVQYDSRSAQKAADVTDSTASAPRQERFSTEELRQLRRDINDAGREIYRRDRPNRASRF